MVFAGVAVAVGSWFVALFAFGNAGAFWLLAIYGCLLVYLAVIRWREELSALHLWVGGVPLQPAQHSGFSPLELAAIQDEDGRDGHLRAELIRHLKTADVRLRWNTGKGCLVVITNDTLIKLDRPSDELVCWFLIKGIRHPVGSKLWSQNGVIDLLEFFCDADTRSVDWTTASFTPTFDVGLRPSVPLSRPIFDADEMARLVDAAQAVNAGMQERNRSAPVA